MVVVPLSSTTLAWLGLLWPAEVESPMRISRALMSLSAPSSSVPCARLPLVRPMKMSRTSMSTSAEALKSAVPIVSPPEPLRRPMWKSRELSWRSTFQPTSIEPVLPL